MSDGLVQQDAGTAGPHDHGHLPAGRSAGLEKSGAAFHHIRGKLFHQGVGQKLEALAVTLGRVEVLQAVSVLHHDDGGHGCHGAQVRVGLAQGIVEQYPGLRVVDPCGDVDYLV